MRRRFHLPSRTLGKRPVVIVAPDCHDDRLPLLHGIEDGEATCDYVSIEGMRFERGFFLSEKGQQKFSSQSPHQSALPLH